MVHPKHKVSRRKIIVSIGNFEAMRFNTGENRTLRLCYKDVEFKLNILSKKGRLFDEYKKIKKLLIFRP